MSCLLKVDTRDNRQEWYETLSNEARGRAKQLRNAGYRVVVSSMGRQVTRYGNIKLTLLTVLGANASHDGFPEIETI